MDERLKKFNVFTKSTFSLSQNRLDSVRKLDEKSFLLKQYKNEFQKTPSNSNTFAIHNDSQQCKKIQSIPLQSTQNILSYSLSIQNLEILPNKVLNPKVASMLVQKHIKNYSAFEKNGIVTTRNHYSKFSQEVHDRNSKTSLPNIKFKNKAVKSQFEANLQFYKRQQHIPIQVQLVNQEQVKNDFNNMRNKVFKSRTELELYNQSKNQQLQTNNFHLKQQIKAKDNNNNNNNSVESQTNVNIDFLEDLNKFDNQKNNNLKNKIST